MAAPNKEAEEGCGATKNPAGEDGALVDIHLAMDHTESFADNFAALEQ